MSLFSWFTQKNNNSIKRDDKTVIEQELKTFNNNTMWPIAKVRKATTINQLQYINDAKDKQASEVSSTLTKKSL